MSIRFTLEKLGITPEIGSAKTVLNIRRNHRGDAKLFHDIACFYGPGLASFRVDLIATARLLASLDDVAAAHDQILDQETLDRKLDLSGIRIFGEAFDPDMPVELADWNGDGAHASLVAAVLACERSVECLQGARDLLAGIFKGPMRDATEETLARSLRGAKAQLEKIKEVLAAYEMPSRPHEIRRNSISYLIVSLAKIIANLDGLRVVCEPDASGDLVEELGHSIEELRRLNARFESLRERCSQKVGQSLDVCEGELNGLINRIGLLAGEAKRRWDAADSMPRTKAPNSS
jgi:hypothetical protein